MEYTPTLGKKKPSEGCDIEFSVMPEMAPLVSPGVYTVVFDRAEKRCMWRRDLLMLWFSICDEGDWLGDKLFMSCNVPRDRKWTLAFKYVRNWMVAAGRRPDRFDRLSTKEFCGKWFKAKMKTVATNSKGEELPKHAQYSVIDELIAQA